MSVQFTPTGFFNADNVPLMFIVRIYTNLYGIGRIQMNNVNISALLYRQIGQSNYYYYENQTINVTHRISTLDPMVNYSVSQVYFQCYYFINLSESLFKLFPLYLNWLIQKVFTSQWQQCTSDELFRPFLTRIRILLDARFQLLIVCPVSFC
jgi:hypothetical protein